MKRHNYLNIFGYHKLSFNVPDPPDDGGGDDDPPNPPKE